MSGATLRRPASPSSVVAARFGFAALRGPVRRRPKVADAPLALSRAASNAAGLAWIPAGSRTVTRRACVQEGPGFLRFFALGKAPPLRNGERGANAPPPSRGDTEAANSAPVGTRASRPHSAAARGTEASSRRRDGFRFRFLLGFFTALLSSHRTTV
jgi:hypothetical protein